MSPGDTAFTAFSGAKLAGESLAPGVAPIDKTVIDGAGASLFIYDLSTLGGAPGPAITVNGAIPGPTLRFREGETAVVRVTNKLDEPSSVHWHGILLDAAEDGVPGFNGFSGIAPGQTYAYRFTIRQAGAYWYHAHSATQEQAGHYGAIVIDPPSGPATQADRDYVLVFSEATSQDPWERQLAEGVAAFARFRAKAQAAEAAVNG